jgi:hypothetical protein
VFDGLSVSVHLVNVDAGDPRVLGIIVEQIEELHVCPDVVPDGDDPVDLDSGARAFPGDLAEELPQCGGTVGNDRVVLDVRSCDEPGYAFFRALLVDHQVVEAKNAVLIANRAAIFRIDEFDHEELLNPDQRAGGEARPARRPTSHERPAAFLWHRRPRVHGSAQALVPRVRSLS